MHRLFGCSALCLALLATTPLSAAEKYRTPPAPLGDIVDAAPTPSVSLSPDRSWMVLIERPSLLAIDDLAQPELRLAGRRISPRTNGRSRLRPNHSLTIRKLGEAVGRKIQGLPPGAKLGSPYWSPDSTHIAFTITGQSDINLWVANVETATARRVFDGRLNATGGFPCEWLADSRRLICTAVPGGNEGPPARSPVPVGPVIQESAGKKAPARTYQDLLGNAHDEALFEYYFSSQLAVVGVDGTRKKIGPEGIVWYFDPSPDGRYIMVQALHRPFSYRVPASRFPRRTEIWSLDGQLVRRLADTPLQEEIPMAFGSVATGPRSFGWRDDAPATVHWVEAQDGGDARAEAEIRDAVYLLQAPFRDEAKLLARLGLRYGGVDWGNDDLALIYEWWWKTRNQRTWIVAPGSPGERPELLFDRSWEDRYGDPGDAVSAWNEYGRRVLLTGKGGKTLFLIGDGASPEGDRPFLDELEPATKKTRRLFHSEPPYYERPVVLLDAKARSILTRRESKQEPPNYFRRDLKKQTLTAITKFPHPTPQLEGLQKELIRYERDDGVKLTATLYLPPTYKEGDGPLPVVMWAYPQEFKSADAAGQVTDSPHRFDRVGWWSPLLFLARGYAVLDDPTMPIIGEGDEEPNDSYVDQLVSSAKAAIDEVARRGVGDPSRVAIGGHSYGAFMTANLLAHSDLFQAGIARSGAYNRTLTPFGFQSEERSLWEAPEIYFAMSPFMHAEKIDEPILLIHGDSDNNSGTYPMQSERFYSALKGQGAKTRLVMLPHESHGYRARESVLHMLWEMSEWLDRYVKGSSRQAQ